MKKIVLGLLVVSMVASLSLQADSKSDADAAFAKAITKGGVTDTEKNYIGRLKMLTLWFMAKFGYYQARDIAMPSTIGHLVVDAMDTYGYTWASDAILKIDRLLDTKKKNEKVAH
jgi:hypothetical protein